MSWRFLDRIKPWYIFAACGAVYLSGLGGGLSLGGDDSTYILISRGFLEKGFFHQVFISNELARSSYYYFILPVILMPFNASAHASYLAMKLIPVAAAIGSVVLLGILLKGLVEERYRKLILILFGLNPWVVEYSGLIMTDMPYLFFMLAALVIFRRYEEQRKLYLLVSSVLVAGIALYTRPVGAALCLALVAFALAKRRFRDTLVILAVLAAVLVPLLAHIGDTASVFFRQFVAKQDYYAFRKGVEPGRNIISGMARNLIVYTGNYLPDIVARPAVSSIEPRLGGGSANPIFAIKFLIGAALGALILAGFINTLRRGFEAYHLYAVFHILMNLLINVYVARYLISLLPFIVLFLVAGAEAAEGRLKFLRGRFVAALALILIALSIFGSGQQVVHARTGAIPAEAKSFIECNDWIRRETPIGAVIMSRKPSYTEVYTGRKAVGYIIIDDPAIQRQYAIDKAVHFIIVGDLGFYLHEASYVEHMIREYPELFRLRYTTAGKPENYVYEIVQPVR